MKITSPKKFETLLKNIQNNHKLNQKEIVLYHIKKTSSKDMRIFVEYNEKFEYQNKIIIEIKNNLP